MSKDTITVDLPIGEYGYGYVKVDHVAHLSRVTWREIAVDGADTWSLTGIIAPAVVAWIERDEWEPLDLPAVGRTIKATLQDGRVETFEVDEIEVAPDWAAVWKEEPNETGPRYIQREYNPALRDPTDIVAWEYADVDEFKPLDVPEVGRTIKVTLRDGRVETFEVGMAFDDPTWAGVWKADSDDVARYIQRARDARLTDSTDIIAWEYVDEPAQPAISAEQFSVMAQFIEDQCFCGSCGTGEEHARKVLAKAGLTVAGESDG